MKHLYSIVLLFILFINCNSTTKIASEKSAIEAQVDPNGSYKVTAIYDQDVSDHNITMIFDSANKGISGSAGCNEYSSNYTAEKNVFSIGFPMASKKSCEKSMQQEKQFLKAISETSTMKSNDTTIELFDTNNSKIITAVKEQ